MATRKPGDYSPGTITKALITTVAKWPPPSTPQHIYDSTLGCFLRHQPSGFLGLYAVLPGRNKRESVEFKDHRGKRTDARAILDPEHAATWPMVRNEIKRLQGKAVTGHDFSKARATVRAIPTLAEALDPDEDNSYADEVIARSQDRGSKKHRSGRATLARLKQFRKAWGGAIKLSEIDAEHVRKWRRSRRRGGVSFETINRDETALRAMLKYYVTQVPRLAVHPLAGLALEEVDSSTKNVRAFTEAEETNIWKAAEAREEKRRQERASGNAWREKRGRTLLPSLENRYTDVLLPAMKIARLTGLRRGEMFSLDWEHVDLHTKEITLEREKAKDFEQRTIPLSKEAVAVLRVWKMQRGGRGAVFVNEQGGRVADLKRGFYALLEDAGINRSNGARVSWNSWRHTFATSLIHRGVDVATVKDLMGHSSVSTVIDRYLSTDVEKKKDAIAQLDVSG